MTEGQAPDPAKPGRDPVEIDTSVAHPARLRNYLAGGEDNFTSDRKAAEYAAGDMPGGMEVARATVRSLGGFMVRAVQHLASERGVDQYLYIGTPIPTAEDVHVVAQRVVPESRIVYVGDDPVVLAHAHALRKSTSSGEAAYVHANLRDVQTLLDQAAETLDYSRPVTLILIGTMSFVPDDYDPYEIVIRLMEPLSSGSYLMVAHSTELYPGVSGAADRLNEMVRGQFTLRSHAEILRFFDGLEMIDPGLVQIDEWRVDGSRHEPESEQLKRWPVPLYAGVGRKP